MAAGIIEEIATILYTVLTPYIMLWTYTVKTSTICVKLIY